MSVRKEKVQIETPRSFKVLHQLVCISEIDFSTRSLTCFTEITVLPLTKHLTKVGLNCGTQIQIERISVNNEAAEYEQLDHFKDFTPPDPPENPLEPNKSSKRRDLKSLSQRHFNAAQKKDADRGGAELCIQLPPGTMNLVQNYKSFKVGIEFCIEDPMAGVHMVTTGKAEDPGNHLFTYRSVTGGSSTHEWVPCVDSWNELCVWKVEIVCDAAHSAVCSGELQNTVYTADMRSRTFHFLINTPTPPVNIGLAVGNFHIWVHPEMNELTCFSPPGLFSMMKHTVGTLDRILEFFEELLAVRFPFPSYKQVFVDQPAEDLISYSGLSIMSISLLYHRKVIDPVPLSRTTLANAVAQQFFGCFVTPSRWEDFWTTSGISRYVTGLYMKRFLGNNEYLFHLHRTLSQVCDYEGVWGPIFLRPPDDPTLTRSLHFDPRSPFTTSPLYVDILVKKAHLAIRMLEKKLGKELLFQVLNKILQLGVQGAESRSQPSLWQNLLLSTDSFFKTMSNLTGQELPTFVEQWIFGGGHAHFIVSYSFNRKRNIVELEMRQEPGISKGRMKYVGPITVTIQELDGSFSHTIQIDGVLSRQDISCHSKARRQRKKKIPLWTGEEVDIDLSHSDPDSPVLWLRVDPDLLLLRRVDLRQPDYHWQYELKHEKDVLAQFLALEVFPRFPTPQTRHTLLEVIENDTIFYRVRTRAAIVLAEVANKLNLTWTGPPAMLNIFKKHFGAQSDQSLPRSNNFSNFQAYFLQQAIPSAMAMLKSHGPAATVEEPHAVTVHKFLLRLLHHNDNSVNKYSDDHYRAVLLRALSQTTGQTPGIRHLADQARSQQTPVSLDLLPKEIKSTLEELTLGINLDSLKPSFCRVVTVSCLYGLSLMQKYGVLPSDPNLWRSFMKQGVYQKLRIAAFDGLYDLASNTKNLNLLTELLETLQTEKDPGVRNHIAKMLSSKPVINSRSSNTDSQTRKFNSPELVERMWETMTAKCARDPRIRCSLIDAYCAMYGRGMPACLAPPKTHGPFPSAVQGSNIALSMPPLMDNEGPHISEMKKSSGNGGSSETGQSRGPISQDADTTESRFLLSPNPQSSASDEVL